MYIYFGTLAQEEEYNFLVLNDLCQTTLHCTSANSSLVLLHF